MSDYVFYDDDIHYCQNQSIIGNEDVYEIGFSGEVEAVCIHKNDVIHLAKLFGLVVFERESEL